MNKYKVTYTIFSIFLFFVFSTIAQASVCGERQKLDTERMSFDNGYVRITTYSDRCSNTKIHFQNLVDDASVKCWVEVSRNSTVIKEGHGKWLKTYADEYEYQCEVWYSHPTVLKSYSKYGFDIVSRLMRGRNRYAFKNTSSKPLSCKFQDQSEDTIFDGVVMPGETSPWENVSKRFFSNCYSISNIMTGNDYAVVSRKSDHGKEYAIKNTAEHSQLCFFINKNKSYAFKSMLDSGEFSSFYSPNNLDDAECFNKSMRNLSSHEGHDILAKREGRTPKVAIKNTSEKTLTCSIHNKEGKVFLNDTITPGMHTSWINYSDYLKNNHSCE